MAAASSTDVAVFAVEPGRRCGRVRATPHANVTALAVSGDGAWVAASTSTKTTVFKVDGGGDMELDGSHAAFRGAKLAVASSEGVVTYALATTSGARRAAWARTPTRWATTKRASPSLCALARRRENFD